MDQSSRLAHIGPLLKGTHHFHRGTPKRACVLEAASYVADEPWSDAPSSVSIVITTLLQTLNDALPFKKRNELLRPFILPIIGTRGHTKAEIERASACETWLREVYVPTCRRASEHENDQVRAKASELLMEPLEALSLKHRATIVNATARALANIYHIRRDPFMDTASRCKIKGILFPTLERSAVDLINTLIAVPTGE